MKKDLVYFVIDGETFYVSINSVEWSTNNEIDLLNSNIYKYLDFINQTTYLSLDVDDRYLFYDLKPSKRDQGWYWLRFKFNTNLFEYDQYQLWQILRFMEDAIYYLSDYSDNFLNNDEYVLDTIEIEHNGEGKLFGTIHEEDTTFNLEDVIKQNCKLWNLIKSFQLELDPKKFNHNLIKSSKPPIIKNVLYMFNCDFYYLRRDYGVEVDKFFNDTKKLKNIQLLWYEHNDNKTIASNDKIIVHVNYKSSLLLLKSKYYQLIDLIMTKSELIDKLDYKLDSGLLKCKFKNNLVISLWFDPTNYNLKQCQEIVELINQTFNNIELKGESVLITYEIDDDKGVISDAIYQIDQGVVQPFSEFLNQNQKMEQYLSDWKLNK